MVFASSISGTDGRVTIPSIGALIGYFSSWKLSATPDRKAYNLSATFGYINPTIWRRTQSGEFTRKIVLQVGKEKFYRLEQADGAKTELKNTQLEMEEVTLWPEEH